MLHKVTSEDVTLTLSHEELRILHNMVYLRGDSYLYDIGEEKGIKDFEFEAEKFHAIPEVGLGFDIITKLHYDVLGEVRMINRKLPVLDEQQLKEMDKITDEIFGDINLDEPKDH
jgi:hypothetical protein